MLWCVSGSVLMKLCPIKVEDNLTYYYYFAPAIPSSSQTMFQIDAAPMGHRLTEKSFNNERIHSNQELLLEVGFILPSISSPFPNISSCNYNLVVNISGF